MIHEAQHPCAAPTNLMFDPAGEDVALTLGGRLLALLAVAFLVVGIWTFSSTPKTSNSGADVTTTIPATETVTKSATGLRSRP
jgi:hypothetical protein